MVGGRPGEFNSTSCPRGFDRPGSGRNLPAGPSGGSESIASTVRIGTETLLAAYCYLVGGGHDFDRVDVPVVQQARPSRGIGVGPGGWLGAGAIVLDGVSVGASAIVGAHAVVTQDVPDYAIVAGAPARVVRDRRQPA